MNASNKFVALLAGGLAFAALAGSALAFTFVLNDTAQGRSNPTGLPIKWAAGTIPLKIMLGESTNLSDGNSFNTSARAAANSWNAVLGSVQFTTTLTSGTAGDNNDVNELVFGADVFGKAFEGDTIAVTTGWSRGSQRTEADIIFNNTRNWDSYRGNLRTAIDLQRVALHEMGHILGLDHPDQHNQSVTAIMNSRVGNLDALATDDINGAQSLYGPPGVPANDNFANAATITLSGNSSTVKGVNTNATKEAGEPNHAGNSGGRSVWWRWTAPSSGSVTLDTGKANAANDQTDVSGGKSSYFDTILAVYTGNTLSGLTAVASNDDIKDGQVQVSSVTFNVTGNTTYRIAVDGFNSNDGDGADSAGITLNLAFTSNAGSLPSITTQPSSVTVTAGGSASFSVTATGTEPLSYQWFLGTTAISGATSATYSISNVSTSQAGTYTVTVSNAAGSVTSSGATLTVNPAPTPTPTPSPSSGGGGGGGGGAPSVWFSLALAALGAGRFLQRRR